MKRCELLTGISDADAIFLLIIFLIIVIMIKKNNYLMNGGMEMSKSKVRELIEDILLENAEEEYHNDVRFTVTLSPNEDFRLRYVANVLNRSRAGLAADFICAAVLEAEEELGLKFGDPDSDYGKAYLAFLESREQGDDE